jgi:cytochrome bd-type quinol oxidase subunit 2
MRKMIALTCLSLIFLGGSVPLVANAQGQFAQGGFVQCRGANDCDFNAFVKTISKLLEFLFQLTTIIAIVVITYAGFLYLTAGENSGNISKAHQLLWYAVIGFLIALSAWLIVEVLLNSLEVGQDFKPSNFR